MREPVASREHQPCKVRGSDVRGCDRRPRPVQRQGRRGRAAGRRGSAKALRSLRNMPRVLRSAPTEKRPGGICTSPIRWLPPTRMVLTFSSDNPKSKGCLFVTRPGSKAKELEHVLRMIDLLGLKMTRPPGLDQEAPDFQFVLDDGRRSLSNTRARSTATLLPGKARATGSMHNSNVRSRPRESPRRSRSGCPTGSRRCSTRIARD
jgi:hypothetical protein